MTSLTVCTILTLSRVVPLTSTLSRHESLCEYERHMCSKFFGADIHRCGIFCPQCDTSGNFLPKQCWGSTGYCWCVDITSGLEILNTRTPPGTELNCGSEGHCPDGWSIFGKQCFIFIDTPQKWLDAEVYCRFDGGKLASVHSDEENHFISSLIRGHSHNFTKAWLGGFDAIYHGFWMWSDGSEFSYENWRDEKNDHQEKGDAKKDGKQHCLGINYQNDLKWFYTSCTDAFPFVCAKNI